MIPSTDVAFVANGERQVEERGLEGGREAYPDPVAAWNAVASECPLRILESLHEYGHYLHYADTKRAGKVVCLRHDCDVPDHFHLTVAQERAFRHTAIAEKLKGEAETVVDDPSAK